MNLVYQYGLRPPVDGQAHVADQLRRAAAYRISLTRLLLAVRAERRELEGEAGLAPLLEAVRAAAEAVVAAPKAQRVDARAVLRDARSALRDARAAAKERLQPLRDELGEWWLACRRDLRARSRCRHGTYTLVERAVDQADATTPLYDEDGAAQDPRWPRASRIGGYVAGHVSEQLQVPVSTAALEDGTRVRIGPSSDGIERRKGRPCATLWLRIGSKPDRSPIWAIWPMTLHRPLPLGHVQVATVSLVGEGPRQRWTVELTVRVADVLPRLGLGRCAVSLGLKAQGAALWVGCWQDCDGRRGDIVLDGGIVSALIKPSSLRSTRDQLRDELSGWFQPWLEHGEPWERALFAGSARWESADRWRYRLEDWFAAREWLGSEQTHATTDARSWIVQDRHIWSWECGQRSQAIRRRRDYYRCLAARLASEHSLVVVEAAKLDPRNRWSPLQGERVMACEHELRGALKSACQQRGVEYREVRPRAGTEPGHAAAAALCESEGDDREAVTARKRIKVSDPAHVGESRKARVDRLRAEKLARMAASRKADGNYAE